MPQGKAEKKPDKFKPPELEKNDELRKGGLEHKPYQEEVKVRQIRLSIGGKTEVEFEFTRDEKHEPYTAQFGNADNPVVQEAKVNLENRKHRIKFDVENGSVTSVKLVPPETEKTGAKPVGLRTPDGSEHIVVGARLARIGGSGQASSVSAGAGNELRTIVT